MHYRCRARADFNISHGLDTRMIKDKLVTQQRMRTPAGRADDGLGPNSEIGARLRALYGAVQDEGVPAQLLDLLEQLDSVEQAQKAKSAPRDGE